MASTASLLTLRDGRTLSYTSYGAPSTTNPSTIFYFHGFPGSRLEGASWGPLAASLSARLICTDRPGCGLSSLQSKRRILDWPSDVELADHLDISRFFVMGISGGSPYVLACVKEIPRERLLGAAVVSGIYPLKLGTVGMMWRSRVLMYVAPWATRLVAPLLDWQVGRLVRDPDPKVLEEWFAKEMSRLPEQDRKCVENEQFRKQMVDSLRESLRPGSQGAAREARLFVSDWGFELEEVQFDGLVLWHGRLDVNCPCRMPEKAVNQMKGAKLKLFEEEAHLSLPINHAEEILKHLLKTCK
ncbi:unnamed protein product [Calypogeia fissa]